MGERTIVLGLGQSPRPGLLLAGAFGLIALLVGWDLFSDYTSGVDVWHVLVESVILLVATVSAVTLVARYWRQRRQLRELMSDLEAVRLDSAEWRSRYQATVDGLARAMQAQFHAWKLTRAEAEIALLLLKGLGLKEIAVLRDTSERTVREQARSVYRKAAVANRASLSAFFLEDLLLPGEADQRQGAHD